MTTQTDSGMVKLIFSDQVPEAVEAGARMMEDSPVLRKQASVTFDCSADELRPDKDHVAIHLAALGDFEHYGFNRNFDSFPKQACVDRHETFVTHGAVFEHHKNRDRDKNMGTIVKSAYNEPMGRIELLIHAHKDKAAEHLSRLEKTGEVSFSMACKVPNDRCYVAGTQILTPEGHVGIEELSVGDYVISHLGKRRKVTNIHHSTYSGELRTISATGTGKTTLTANHPIFSVPKAKLRAKSGRRYRLQAGTNYVPMYDIDLGEVTDAAVLTAADRVRVGDSFITPVKLLPEVGAAANTRHNYQCWGDYRVTTVDKIESSYVTDLPVYNLTVAVDETYIADGFATHNCSVCDNLRKSAKDPKQCEHIRDDFGKVARDGTVTGTHNDLPTWFDISFVSRPADRIAWNLKMASAGTQDAIKAAEDAGIWVPDQLETSTPGYQEKLALTKQLVKSEANYLRIAEGGVKTATDRYLSELLKSATCTIPDAAIDQLRREMPDSVMRKLAESRIVMDVDSFFKYAFGLDYGSVADSMPSIREDVAGPLFSRLYKSGAYQKVCRNNYFDVDTAARLMYGLDRLSFGDGIKVASQTCSFDSAIVRDRIVDMTIQGLRPTVKKGSSVDDGAPNGGACIYAAYKLSALRSVCRGGEESERDVALAVAQNMVNKTGE